MGRALWTRFVDEVEGCLRRAPEMRESPCRDHIANALFAGLRTESQAHFLGQRCRGAAQRRDGIENPANRIQVFLDSVTRKRFYDHPGTIGGKRFAHVCRGADGIAHVVKAVEKCDQVVIPAGIIFGSGNLKFYLAGNAGAIGALAGGIDGACVIVEPDECRFADKLWPAKWWMHRGHNPHRQRARLFSADFPFR